MEKVLVRASVLHAVQRRKPWHLSASSCFCYSSPIYLTASPVPRSLFKSLDGVLPLISFVWMPLPLPRRATLRQRLYERTLARSAYTTLLTQPRVDTVYSLDDAACAYIQMERLAFPQVHWRVQACGDERGTRGFRGEAKMQTRRGA